MGTLERVGMAIVGIALVTTLILPDRQTIGVLDAAGRFFTTSLKTAMGR